VRVLVVDDQQGAASALAVLLKLTRCDVRVAYDAETGLSLAREFLPNLLFADIGLAIVDGHELARCVCDCPELDGTVLVAVSEYGDLANRELSLHAGFDEFLVKPVAYRNLCRMLARIAQGIRN
jgi:DNA-binding response OmpR family regulator